MAYSIEYFHPQILEHIESWPVDLLASHLRLVSLLVDHGPALKLPYSRAMGKGLFELRPSGKAIIGRSMYCFLKGQRIILVHAFIKKTAQTPDSDLKLALKRIKELKNA
jgi:phage-related protein